MRKTVLLLLSVMLLLSSGCQKEVPPLPTAQEMLTRHARAFEVELPEEVRIIDYQHTSEGAWFGEGMWFYAVECEKATAGLSDEAFTMPEQPWPKLERQWKFFTESGLSMPEWDFSQPAAYKETLSKERDDGFLIVHRPGETMYYILVWYT